MKAKGLTKNATERHRTHQKYVDQVLGDEKVVSCKMNNIQSKNFNMYTQYISVGIYQTRFLPFSRNDVRKISRTKSKISLLKKAILF